MGSIIDKAKGKAKEAEGRATGDRLRTAQGRFEGKKADVEGMAKRASRRVRAGVARAKAKVRIARAKSAARTRSTKG